MIEIVLRACPICGKEPKVKRDYGYESLGFGGWCTIQCKPFLRKSHLITESGKASYQRAFREAAELWNQEVDNYNKE